MPYGIYWHTGAFDLPMHYGTSYNKCSFYQGFYIAAGRRVLQALETVVVLMVTALVAAHCSSKGSFEDHYEQL